MTAFSARKQSLPNFGVCPFNSLISIETHPGSSTGSGASYRSI
jgi:hypothetical protein